MIDLAGIAANATATAFEVAGQIVVVGNYIRTGAAGDPDYDPVTGVIDEKAETIENVRGLVLNFKTSEIDGQRVKLGDEKVLIQKVDVPTLAEPEQYDRFIAGAVRRDVVECQADPTNSIWILHCRRFVN